MNAAVSVANGLIGLSIVTIIVLFVGSYLREISLGVAVAGILASLAVLFIAFIAKVIISQRI